MAMELERLVQQVKRMDVTLVAGEKGIHHLVSWVHMVETTEASTFLEGGEITFTTGLGLTSTSLIELVRTLYEHHVAGIMINIGPFISEIPKEVIDFCNAKELPLYVIPWRIHLAEVMRIFCFSITKEEQRMLETASAFKNAIFFPKQEELYVVPLSQRGFQVDWKYNVCVMKLDTSSAALDFSEEAHLLERLVYSIDSYGHHYQYTFAVFAKDSELLIVSAQMTEEELHAFILDLKKHVLKILPPSMTLSLGCGKRTQSVRCIYKSYAQAKSIQKLQESHKLDPSLCFYTDMGIYKLLMAIDDREILTDFCAHTIIPLTEYDSANECDLTTTLNAYLNHNGSVKDTAEELFVHRNTVNYKINKIEELLDVDLSSLNDRLLLKIGLMIGDML